MATTTSTMAMEAMIESLKEASVMVHQVSSEIDVSAGEAYPVLKSMVLTPSTLCSACTTVLHGSSRSSAAKSVFGNPDLSNASSYRGEGLAHHSLNDISKAAMRGCHLCLVVYLGLDTEALQKFARTLATDTNPATADIATTSSQQVSSGTIGFAHIEPITNDQAKLSFQYIRAPLFGGNEAALRHSLSRQASVNSSLVTSFDFANFESQRASVGYFYGSTSRASLTQSDMMSEVRTSIDDEGASLRVELTLLNPRHALELGIQTIPMNSACTASVSSFEIAKDWIRECTESHVQCTTIAGPRWRPAHLLDVSIKDSKNVPGVKLVDGMLLDRQIEYVTLSHAWGPSRPIRLHKGTMPALRQGVARSSLAKTLAEAATVADKLGYKYLWVDSLCIMHDNEQAVLNEMSQMDRIYGSAALNIAATCAGSDSEGFIRPRNVSALQPCVLGVQGRGIDDGTYMVLRSTTWNDLVDRAPLNRRAWVLQERALARRTLHFTKSELMWECRQTCCSEIYPRGMPKEMTGITVSSLAGTSAPVAHKFNKQLHHQQAGRWGQIIELYTAGRLSFWADKLLAISGLARQHLIANRLNESDYVVGLWRSELPQSLLWEVRQGRRPPGYRAPTWSWAGIDGRVKCIQSDHSSLGACLEVIDINTKHRFDDVFGLCESARLKVCGFLVRGLLQRRRGYWGETPCSIQFPRSRVRVDFQVAHFDEHLPISVLETLEVYVLPVVCTPKKVEGLLLVATACKGEFTRLGTFTLPADSNQANCEKFRMVMKGDFGMTSYEGKLEHTDGFFWFAGKHKYVVTLV